jgi:AI-2 transport protein TqsA
MDEMMRTSTFSPASKVLITVAAVVVTIVGLSLGRGVIGPFAVAAVLVIVAHPIRASLRARKVPAILATAAVIAVAYLILLVIGVLLVVAASQFASLIPMYADQLQAAEQQLTESLQSLGISQQAATQVGSVISPGQLLTLAGAISSAVLGAATASFFVLAYILFMAADAAMYAPMAERFAATKATAIRVITHYAASVRRYLVVNTIFGGIVAFLDGIVLWILGLPVPLLWAILAFITNYIPNIGFVIALIPPTVLAWLIGGWGPAVVVVATYCIINFTLQQLVQPKFVSDAVRLSLTLTFFSVVLWTVVLGPVGALLAIPASLLVRALLLEVDPDAYWARWITGDRVEPEGEEAHGTTPEVGPTDVSKP